MTPALVGGHGRWLLGLHVAAQASQPRGRALTGPEGGGIMDGAGGAKPSEEGPGIPAGMTGARADARV
jgi:hypothetical protein